MEELIANIGKMKKNHKMEIFIITPYKFDPLFEKKRQIVESASKQFGINVHYGPYPPYDEKTDKEKIVNLYKDIDYFIADLSYERPSCYFEVGFAQGLNKSIHLIAMDGTEIHQVLDRDKVYFYNNLHEYEDLINSILRDRGV